MNVARAISTAAAVAAILLGALPAPAAADPTVAVGSESLLLDANTRLRNLPETFTGLLRLPSAGGPLYVRSLLQRFSVNPTQQGLPQAKGKGVAETVCFNQTSAPVVGMTTQNFDRFGNAVSGRFVAPSFNCDFTGVEWDFLGNQIQRAGSSITTLGIAERVQPGANTSCFFPDAMCLQEQRFRVEVDWRQGSGLTGTGFAAPRSNDSGLFYFLNNDNTEMTIKVLNACNFNNRYWVFASATTNVEFTLTVTDTQRPEFPGTNPKTYTNPLGKRFAPVQDTQAFATCP
jgi:hypothetical protein